MSSGVVQWPTHTSDRMPADLVVAACTFIFGFCCSLANAASAARAYEQLASQSDAQLAQRGLSRQGLPDHIIETYLD